MKRSIIILVLALFAVFNAQLLAQEEKEGKLGDFEDAVEKGSDDDDDVEAGIGWFEIMINLLWSSEPEPASFNSLDEDSSDMEEYDAFAGWHPRQVSFGAYPFDRNGFVHGDDLGKPFLVRMSGSFQQIDSHTSGMRLQADMQLSGYHGLRGDVTLYRENLRTRTDQLKVISLDYRYLFVAQDRFMLSGIAGGRLLLPDKERESHIGLDLGLSGQWFIANPLSLDFMFQVVPILDEFRFDREENPAFMELEIGAGLHFQHIEVFGGYRGLFPDGMSGAIHGPQIGFRLWL